MRIENTLLGLRTPTVQSRRPRASQPITDFVTKRSKARGNGADQAGWRCAGNHTP
jgi:hypothetical protein